MDHNSSEQSEDKPTSNGNATTTLLLPPPPPSSSSSTLKVEQLDIQILPVIYEIIRCVEKDPLDNAAKQKESLECSQKILELKNHLDSVRDQIKRLPGIDCNKEEQLLKLESLKNQLKLKQDLLHKYKNLQF